MSEPVVEREDPVETTGVAEENGAGQASEEAAEESLTQPQELPVLPLRGMVVYPQTALPLTVGQPRSMKLVDSVVNSDRVICLVASEDPENETPGPDEVFRVGTRASIHRLSRSPDGTLRLLVQGLARVRIEAFVEQEPWLRASVSAIPEQADSDDELEIEALMRNVVDQFTRMAELVPSIPGELISSALNMEDPLQLVYAIATYVRIELREAQNLLEIDSLEGKLRHLMALLAKELEVLELGRKIQSEAQSGMEKVQREYFLREQLRAIQRELGESDEQTAEVEEFRKRIKAAGMTEEAQKEGLRELERLSRLPTAAAEYGVIRTWLDWLTSLPWAKRSEDRLDIGHARNVLDEDHYGLKDIKERILEYLAVRKLRAERSEEQATPRDSIRRDRKGAILAFVGPPGVGKTSLGASIARAMGREFVRMSLGGVRDEAEIRGFRRTYVGAMPGRLIQTLRRVESINPVIMMDEVDKLGRGFQGDPASALLEVLDPEQNHEFRDHYLDVALDLSEVLFITTANELEPIPGPLRDRMEIIQLSGYTEQEKAEIARQYLVPRQIRENGLRPTEFALEDEALLLLIRDYTREAGVRGLEREIGRAARKVVTQIAEAESESVHIDEATLRQFLGKPRYGWREEIAGRTDRPGVAIGLAWTPVGGEVLFVEAARMAGNKGFQYTGQLGEVMQESARAALSYLRSQAGVLGIDAALFECNDIHLHVPAGAVRKDGPSAGITMVVALASLLTGRPVRADVAMTGEITLRGKVLPVGGIKDKVLAAHRLGVDTVIIPRRNENDLDDLPEEIREALDFVLVEQAEEVLATALVAEVAPVT